MSSTSLNNFSAKNFRELSQNDGIQQTINLVQHTDDKSSLGSSGQNSIYENSPSTRSVGMKVSPVSTFEIQVNEEMKSILQLAHIKTPINHSQTESDSFDAQTLPDYDIKLSVDSNEIIKAQVLKEDLHLPLKDEQDTSSNQCSKNQCTKKRRTSDGDPIEKLVSGILAFDKESLNECISLNSAVKRLAIAIEDQTVLLTCMNTLLQEMNTNHIASSDKQ